jgi:hypothetical protein
VFYPLEIKTYLLTYLAYSFEMLRNSDAIFSRSFVGFACEQSPFAYQVQCCIKVGYLVPAKNRDTSEA